MSVAYDTTPPPKGPRGKGPASLLNRIEKPALLDRLGKGESKPKSTPPA